MLRWYEVRKWGNQLKYYCENQCGQIINSKKRQKNDGRETRKEGRESVWSLLARAVS